LSRRIRPSRGGITGRQSCLPGPVA
jgi:hypothetical protein